MASLTVAFVCVPPSCDSSFARFDLPAPSHLSAGDYAPHAILMMADRQLLCDVVSSSAERRCAERRDLSGGRDERDGQLMAEIFRVKFRTTVRIGPLSFLGRLKPFFSFWQRKKRMGSKKGR